MEVVHVPQATQGQPQIASGKIAFVDYVDHTGASRNRVLFDCYAFSFIQHGEKQIFRDAGSTSLTPGYGMLISEGNSIIAEHKGTATCYHSLVIFFPGEIGRAFMASRKVPVQADQGLVPYIHFQTNAYINEYVRNIRAHITAGQSFSEEMAAIKVNELLTAVYELAPALMTSIFEKQPATSLKTLIERNLLNPLSLEELAFLANRSLSSFKRDFQKTYGISPQKYIRERRLEMARADLATGKLASEIFPDYGYQHLANFIAAFKRKFGATPSDL